jgi:pimeloyl-ACP methyl ester carboxylesterase
VKSFDSEGVRISYLDEGRGDPVLLIHGFASHVRMNWIDPGWVRLLTGAGYRVLAFDNRGHGQSEKLYRLEDYGGPLMAEDARRLLDHEGIARADVMGYSMGARIAAFLMLRHPERVRSAIFGGLGINMVRGMAGTGPIAHALEAPSIEHVTNPTARTFRAFAEQTHSDLKALAACIRSSRHPSRARPCPSTARSRRGRRARCDRRLGGRPGRPHPRRARAGDRRTRPHEDGGRPGLQGGGVGVSRGAAVREPENTRPRRPSTKSRKTNAGLP